MGRLLEYASELQRLVIEDGVILFKNNRSGPSPRFVKFAELCKEEGNTICDEDIKFAQMVYQVVNPDVKCKCYCGKRLELISIPEGFGKYCSIRCRSKDPEFAKSLSDAKTAQYNDPEQKAAIEAKKIATNMKNLGVAHPMQNVESFEKQVAASYRNRKIVGKNKISLQGYEPEIYQFLSLMYGEISKGTDYMRDNNVVIDWVDDLGKQRYSYPDFFVPSMNSFIEVKSPYTMRAGEYKIGRCIDRLGELGFGYILAVVSYKRRSPRIQYTMHNTEFILDPDDGGTLDFFNPHFDTKEELAAQLNSK